MWLLPLNGLLSADNAFSVALSGCSGAGLNSLKVPDCRCPTRPQGGETMSDLERLLYDRKTAAQLLSVSVRTIDYALARGEFEWKRIGRRKLITARSLKGWAGCNHYGSVKAPERDQTGDVAA
jgi:hypothetical protein